MNKTVLALSLVFAASSAFAGEINIKVKGMVCPMCAQGIQKKFKAREEVQTVEFDSDKKMVILKTKEGKDLSDESITDVITKAGYNVAGIERK